MSSGLHVVVPYPATNASVRARVLSWRAKVDAGALTVYGPGFQRGRPPVGVDTLVFRNVQRFTRGGVEERLLERAAVAMYELDDGLPWDDGHLSGLGRWWKRPWPRTLVASRAAAAADRLIVGNEVLAEWAASICDDVRVIPTCVESGRYRAKEEYEPNDPPLIGWLGSPATDTYLWGIAEALVAVNRRLGAQVEVVGSSGAVPSVMAPFTRCIPWSEAIAEQILSTWDVGVMPLRDGPYERAKCSYKLLQYAAAGLPAVGSPVGMNRTVLDQMDGLAPGTEAEWVDALIQLLTEDVSRRAQRGAAGRNTAIAYSYDTWLPAWKSAVGLAR
jgi:glycosyltransferase involved in cell wall biosynthesis